MYFSARYQQDRRSVTTHTVMSTRPARKLSLKLWFGLFAGAAMVLAATHSASAQGRVDAQYEATLSGIPVGRGAWTIEIGDDQFAASAVGGTSGLLKAFCCGSGTRAPQGRVVKGEPVRANYAPHITP